MINKDLIQEFKNIIKKIHNLMASHLRPTSSEEEDSDDLLDIKNLLTYLSPVSFDDRNFFRNSETFCRKAVDVSASNKMPVVIPFSSMEFSEFEAAQTKFTNECEFSSYKYYNPKFFDNIFRVEFKDVFKGKLKSSSNPFKEVFDCKSIMQASQTLKKGFEKKFQQGFLFNNWIRYLYKCEGFWDRLIEYVLFNFLFNYGPDKDRIETHYLKTKLNLKLIK